MGHVKIIVDHDKIEYSGPLNVNHLINLIGLFIHERGFDFAHDKDFEINNTHGKFIEYQIAPWKWISDYHRYIIKVRILGYDIVKADVVSNGKKSKVDMGRVIIVLDGFIDYDLQVRWEHFPMLHFIRAMYDNFIFKAYTERFEHMLVNDINHLHDQIEKFLNTYRHYSVVSHQGP